MPCPAMELGVMGPFVAVFRFESRGKTLVATWCVVGANVLVARSGTACRAPTVRNDRSGESERCRARACLAR